MQAEVLSTNHCQVDMSTFYSDSTDLDGALLFRGCIALWICLLIASVIQRLSGEEAGQEETTQLFARLLREELSWSRTAPHAEKRLTRPMQLKLTNNALACWQVLVSETDACTQDEMYMARINLAGLQLSEEDKKVHLFNGGSPSLCVQIDGQDVKYDVHQPQKCQARMDVKRHARPQLQPSICLTKCRSN
mmetsp:Transcript_11743/g.21368  ORF Transcript_11743/g.21368 Transcript_11743/m.21368 type:complete len:191 (-) Transcript_11743:52-624(-)